MNLHTFGDSHARGPWIFIDPKDLKYFDEISTNELGPHTMSYFGFAKFKVVDITTFNLEAFPPHVKYFNVQEDDAVVFSFGEIDCRAHLIKPEHWAEYEDDEAFCRVPYKEIIDEIIPRYFEAIKMNVEQFKHLNTMVANIVPTARKELLQPNLTFPNQGTNESRKRVTEYMNAKIKEYCQKYGYIYFDIYDKYCDADGYLEPSLSHGIHVQDPIYYVEFLNNLKLEKNILSL